MKMDGSHCLRSEYSPIPGVEYAKDYCSKRTRCVGIEFVGRKPFRNKVEDMWKICFDSVYTNTAWNKYQNSTNVLLKKVPNYGKYT